MRTKETRCARTQVLRTVGDNELVRLVDAAADGREPAVGGAGVHGLHI